MSTNIIELNADNPEVTVQYTLADGTVLSCSLHITRLDLVAVADGGESLIIGSGHTILVP